MGEFIDLSALLAESGVGEVLDELDRELVGLAPVKTRLREIASLLVVDKARAALGIEGAKRAGMRAFGFIGASHRVPADEKMLLQAGADQVFADMKQLPSLLHV